MEKRKIDIICDVYPDESFLQADGYDDAIIGVNNEKLVYSITKCINILMTRDGMTPFDAHDYFEFNVQGAYVGEKTPIWVDDTLLK